MAFDRNGIYIRSFLNWLKLWGKKGYWNKSWLLSYGWQWVRPAFKIKTGVSRIYKMTEIAAVRNEVIKIGKMFPLWFPRIFEPETMGIRAWEYGTLLSTILNFKNLKVLDVGTGGSLLPDYLAGLGAKVRCVDIDKPLEEKKYQKNISYVQSSMTKLPFKNNSYDVVLCISALEHLDMKRRVRRGLWSENL